MHIHQSYLSGKKHQRTKSLLLRIRYPENGIKESHNMELPVWEKGLNGILSSLWKQLRKAGKRNGAT